MRFRKTMTNYDNTRYLGMLSGRAESQSSTRCQTWNFAKRIEKRPHNRAYIAGKDIQSPKRKLRSKAQT